VDADLENQQIHVADLTTGQGDAAAAGDYVKISYSVWVYLDGAKGHEIDHSGDEPLGFVLGDGSTLAGLDEGLVGQRIGGTRKLVIGPEKATGPLRPRGVAQQVALWYEVTLEDIVRVESADIAIGDGVEIGVGDYVQVRYTGWLFEDGQRGAQFDSNHESDVPFGFMIGAGMVIRGWELGLPGMRVGGIRRLVIPPELAYGSEGKDDIPGGATLEFEIEVVARPEVTVEILQEGQGTPVEPGHRVQIHLVGWTDLGEGEKGEKFQDSHDLGGPFTILLGNFKIQPGLELGIRGMRMGELRRLEVPSALAFGHNGFHRGDRTLVPPDTDVIFEVELVSAPLKIR
jgi:peptidylprolyl isomerase